MSLDFVTIESSIGGRTKMERCMKVYPVYNLKQTKDLMVRGGAFYAVWDEPNHIWSTDEFRLVELVDEMVEQKVRGMKDTVDDIELKPMYVRNFQTKKWSELLEFMKKFPDNFHDLDTKVTFANQRPEKKEFISRTLPYELSEGECPNYDELMSTLYDEDNRQKLEWAIGSIFCGDSTTLQKFIVIYGSGGTGKSTFLNILEQLFDGYTHIFDAKAMGEKTNSFALASIASNPLVAIQHDGDLSRIEDNTRLNSVVAHEKVTINEKFKSTYSITPKSFLFMGTNKPVRITDAKSGIIRRLIDVHPTGNLIQVDRYFQLINAIPFELGRIASHCISVYRSLGKHYYDSYRPNTMMGDTNDFYNFVEEMYPRYSRDDGTTLNEAWLRYKEYCTESDVKYPFSKRIFKSELKNYFGLFEERGVVDGKRAWNVYKEFKKEMFSYAQDEPEKPTVQVLELDKTTSLFDELYSDMPAQLAKPDGTPQKKWSNVTTTLEAIDTRKLHYVKVPENHIVIDFDLQDHNGNKLLEENLKAAAKWPLTYAELSKSGAGVHLHYIYDGDVTKLSRVYDDNIEIKVYTGNSSLRRKLTSCNGIPVAHISSGLPLKGGDEKLIKFEGLKNEKALRTLIKRNMNKEVHPGTKPSVDFIKKILDDAYDQGMAYDVTDMRPAIMAFAANSTHHSEYCLKLVNAMHFHSENPGDAAEEGNETIIFFDVEVFPNLFVVVWKAAGKNPVQMINPAPQEIEDLMKFRLVGFNCRRYDNHILYARMMGYSNEELYRLSKRIIEKSRNSFFNEAYNISYADVYEFSSKKQSLKKFEVELGIHHQELGFDWDKPVPEDQWQTVADYCINDVVSTEAVFNDRHEDFVARELLSDLSGRRINDTARQHATKIIFGNDRHPQDQFVYTDLSEMFPGYKFEAGHSSYRGEDPSEGGYVYAEPGMYENVALLDIASMHPTSIIQLNLFGDKYTKRFKDIVDARLLIKHKEYDKAGKMFDGKLEQYLDTPENSDALAQALKMVINPIYGYTKATFDCEFRDPRNVDNIVAKRGALFMINLKHEVQERGYTVAHIKTDSIKIPNADKEIIDFVVDYGKQYGYTFEHEDTYSKFCLVNDAVYIAKSTMGKHAGKWTATGAQFKVPYVFKTLFSHEKIVFEDLCETKAVGGNAALYLDFSDGEGDDNYRFVGKVGSFCPMKKGTGGGILLRGDAGNYSAATGTKGYFWLESELVRKAGKEKDIDKSYYTRLVDEAVDTISQFGDFELFVGGKDD